MVDGNADWPLLLGGSVGVGKTCAALAVCDHVPLASFWELDGLCDYLREAEAGIAVMHVGTESRRVYPGNVWEHIMKAPLAVLDEIGCRERASDFVYRTLKRFLDYRRGKPTVLITNLEVPALRGVFDDRIVSRMIAGTAVRLDGPDRRNTPVE